MNKVMSIVFLLFLNNTDNQIEKTSCARAHFHILKNIFHLGIAFYKKVWYNIRVDGFSPVIKSQFASYGEIFRLRRRYPHPAPDKRACRSLGGVCEVDLSS